jgi:hypothetical protein
METWNVKKNEKGTHKHTQDTIMLKKALKFAGSLLNWQQSLTIVSTLFTSYHEEISCNFGPSISVRRRNLPETDRKYNINQMHKQITLSVK